MAKRPTAVLELPVTFGNLNVGDETARLGISTGRGNLTVTQADRHLCGKRLTGKIIARVNGASADQESLPGVEDDTELEGVFDVAGFSASPKKISTGLTFLISTIDIETLSHFAKREGRLVVQTIDAIPEEESDGE